MSWCCHVRGLCDALYSWFVILADWIYNGILKYTGCRSVVNFTSLCSHDDPSIFSQPSVLMFMFPASCSSTSLKRLLPSWRTSMNLVVLHQLVFSLEAQNTWWSKVNLVLLSEERRYGLKQIDLPETNSVHVCNTIYQKQTQFMCAIP